jgi:hypothetical protein
MVLSRSKKIDPLLPHREHWLVYGTPMVKETWRAVPGFRGFYKVSSEGRLWSSRRRRVMKPCHRRNGYRQIVLYRRGKGKTCLVHRLVVLAFPGPKPSDLDGLEVNHANGSKSDNRRSNLEVMTRKQNLEHARAMGLLPCRKGERNGRAVVNCRKVKRIRRLIAAGSSVREAADKMRLPWALVYKVARRLTWRHLA